MNTFISIFRVINIVWVLRVTRVIRSVRVIHARTRTHMQAESLRFDTVLCAVGRYPLTQQLGLDKVTNAEFNQNVTSVLC